MCFERHRVSGIRLSFTKFRYDENGCVSKTAQGKNMDFIVYEGCFLTVLGFDFE